MMEIKEAYLLMCAYMFPLFIALNIAVIIFGLYLIVKLIYMRYVQFCDEWDKHIRRINKMAEKEKNRINNIGL